MDVKNKVALITGGTHGIGAQVAIQLAKEQIKLALIARHDIGDELRQQLDEIGATYEFIAADLSQAEECSCVVEKVFNRYGQLDILIHCAGGPAPGNLMTVSGEDWYKAFDIHLHAIFHLSKTVIPYLKNSDAASIILISSAAGLRGVKNALAYAVVKGAIPQFTRALAFELSEHDIRVNCVSPGVIRTRFQDFLTEEQVQNNLKNRIPLRREGEAQDVADVITMLVKNKFITGENIVIDGGMSMRIV